LRFPLRSSAVKKHPKKNDNVHPSPHIFKFSNYQIIKSYKSAKIGPTHVIRVPSLDTGNSQCTHIFQKIFFRFAGILPNPQSPKK
jgi:hypothetical protein